MLEGRRDLIDLLHPGAHRPAPHEHDDVAWVDGTHVSVGRIVNPPCGMSFDGGDGVDLAREDARGPGLAVDAVGIDHAWVDGRALDDRTFRGQIAARKTNRAGQPSLAGTGR